VSRVQAGVLTGAVSCYPASMVNLIWFANEKCLSHWATWKHESVVLWSKKSTSTCWHENSTCGHEIRRLAIQKCNHLQTRCANALPCSNA